jgi:hypothetical protein
MLAFWPTKFDLDLVNGKRTQTLIWPPAGTHDLRKVFSLQRYFLYLVINLGLRDGFIRRLSTQTRENVRRW